MSTEENKNKGNGNISGRSFILLIMISVLAVLLASAWDRYINRIIDIFAKEVNDIILWQSIYIITFTILIVFIATRILPKIEGN